jgi:hypothetical protein
MLLIGCVEEVALNQNGDIPKTILIFEVNKTIFEHPSRVQNWSLV